MTAVRQTRSDAAALKKPLMLIGGKWVESASGEVLEVEDPAHRRPVAEDLHVVIAVGTLVERTLMPSRRQSSAIEVSPGRPSSTMRIFSSAAWCFRVARRMLRRSVSDDAGASGGTVQPTRQSSDRLHKQIPDHRRCDRR